MNGDVDMSQKQEFPRILFIEDVALLIGKAATTIRTCATNEKYKHLIPRPFKMPNSRRLAWLEEDVLAWLKASTVVSPAVKRKRGRPTKAEQLRGSASK